MATEDVPKCPKCGHKALYIRKDGSVRCRACGYDGPAAVKE